MKHVELCENYHDDHIRISLCKMRYLQRLHCGNGAEITDVYKTWTGVHGPPHGPGPWTTPWTTPNFQQEIAPVNMKIYRRSGYEQKH